MGADGIEISLSDLARIPIGELLLQRHEMLLIERVHDFGPSHVEVSTRVTQNHPLVEDPRGMPAWVGIELMAQAISVFSALERRAQGLGPRIGLLLGARNFEARTPYFRVGAKLSVRATLAWRDATGLGVFECTIRERETLLAQGQVKGYMPEDIDRFLRSAAHG